MQYIPPAFVPTAAAPAAAVPIEACPVESLPPRKAVEIKAVVRDLGDAADRTSVNQLTFEGAEKVIANPVVVGALPPVS